jgi:hypothetical protein
MRKLEESGWRVNDIEVKWYRGRDHQVINPHRNGEIIIDIWTGAANSTRTLRYLFAAGDVVENDIDKSFNIPEDEKVAWFSEVVDDEDELSTELDSGVPSEWKDISAEELEWLGFTVAEESPEWHYQR